MNGCLGKLHTLLPGYIVLFSLRFLSLFLSLPPSSSRRKVIPRSKSPRVHGVARVFSIDDTLARLYR